MKTLPLVIAAGVLGLWGCASSSRARAGDLEAAYQEPLNEKELAQKGRMGAPTVYNGEATGGAGFTVTTGDGQLWAPEVAPGNTVTRTPSDSRRSIERQDIQSEVIDEGPTDKAPQQ